jgi:hypothetical protein
MAFVTPVHSGSPVAVTKNSWRGLTPLRSSIADVARVLGTPSDEPDGRMSGPFKVDDGEVTFSYLTPSIARIYRAPSSMVGKVFTIYFRPNQPQSRSELVLSREFKRCAESRDRLFFYMVSDSGVAYQFNRSNESLETIIYQPARHEVRRLAVNTECVF